METNIFLLFLGLFLLVKGSGIFVESAASIAKKFGISEFFIGLTLVAVGTSIPELASSITASIEGSSGIIMGNVVGSTVANIGLIAGIAAIAASIKTNKSILRRDGYIMLFVTLVLFIIVFNLNISKLEAGFLLLLYVAYIFFLVDIKNKPQEKNEFKDFISYFYKFKYIPTIKNKLVYDFNHSGEDLTPYARKKVERFFKISLSKDFTILFLAGFATVVGAKYLVEQTIFFAGFFNVPETFMGISLIAIGTSLPELSVTISAAKKGFGNIVLGNIIGSNIANILLVLGVSGMISPIGVIKSTAYFSVPFIILMSLLLLKFIKSGWSLKKKEGIIFLLLYVLFLAILFFWFKGF